jgi:hypothetical protein
VHLSLRSLALPPESHVAGCYPITFCPSRAAEAKAPLGEGVVPHVLFLSNEFCQALLFSVKGMKLSFNGRKIICVNCSMVLRSMCKRCSVDILARLQSYSIPQGQPNSDITVSAVADEFVLISSPSCRIWIIYASKILCSVLLRGIDPHTAARRFTAHTERLPHCSQLSASHVDVMIHGHAWNTASH